MAKLQGRSVAAISPQQADEAAQGIPPHWNLYVTVEDVDAATASVGGAGGQALAGPFDVFDAGRHGGARRSGRRACSASGSPARASARSSSTPPAR